MIITLSPIRADWAPLSLAVLGPVLTINSVPVDLAGYDHDAAGHDLIAAAPELVEGVWHVTVLFPIGAEASEDARFPESIIANDGPIDLPT